MTVTLTDQLVGQVVGGRYEVLSRIARGGMATVYLATDRTLGRNVALKVMHPHLAEGHAGEDFVARFRREAMSAARLAHPGLVAVFDHGQDGDTSFLVMEYIQGSNLRKTLLEKGPLPVGDALQTVEAVLEALAVAHAAGVIHRDIKPENVLVAADGSIKVADFGLARAMAEASSTSTGTVLGSVAYLAPELVTYGQSDERTDLYSVGVLLYELITGHQPFTGTTPLQIAYLHVSSDVPAPSAILEWMPAEVDRLVAALSSRNPDDRPADAAAALDLVRRTRGGLSGDVLSRRAGSVTRRALLRSAAAPRGSDDATDRVAGNGKPNGKALNGAALNGAALDPQAAPAEAPEQPGTPRRRRWLLVPLVAAAAALALGAGAWWNTAGPGAFTMVPEGLLGASISDAEAALTGVGLVVTTEEVFHPTAPPGEVLTVEPAEATQIARDGSVVMVVSKGPDLRTVAVDPVGMRLMDVEDALGDAGFSVPTALHVYSDTAPAGTVISATVDGKPIAMGAKYPVGTQVILTCSDGLAPVTIPNVVGLTRDQGVAALDALGLKVTEEQAYHATIAAGIIKAQSPAADARGHRFDTVHIVISKGPQPAPPPPKVTAPAGTVLVPNVVGKLKADARDKIQAAGFEVNWNFDQCANGDTYACKAGATSPAGGTYAAKGSTVTIYLRDP